MLRNLRDLLVKLHRDEGGIDMVEYVMLIAIIALPLLAVIIWFWQDIVKWANSLWGGLKTSPDQQQKIDPGTLP